MKLNCVHLYSVLICFAFEGVGGGCGGSCGGGCGG